MTVAEAAVLLGRSTDAVRSRLNRGTLDGRKDAGGWVVYLPRPSATGQRPAADRDATAAYETLVETQRTEIEFLRDQLAQRSQELAAERERFDVLHREARGRIPALGAGQDVPRRPKPAPDATDTAEPRPGVLR